MIREAAQGLLTVLLIREATSDLTAALPSTMYSETDATANVAPESYSVVMPRTISSPRTTTSTTLTTSTYSSFLLAYAPYTLIFILYPTPISTISPLH